MESETGEEIENSDGAEKTVNFYLMEDDGDNIVKENFEQDDDVNNNDSEGGDVSGEEIAPGADDDVRGGGRGKPYSKCKRRGKEKKVKKMLEKNTDHDLNLAFAKRVLAEEEERKDNIQREVGDISGDRNMASLVLIKIANFSRDQYLNLKYWLESRALLGEENSSLPSWGIVTGDVRDDALPEGWPAEGDVTETEAKVGLQALLDHSVQR